MTGEKDLQQLIRSMSPVLEPRPYVFCTIPGAEYGDYAHCAPIATMQEKEGLTLILEQGSAEKEGLFYDGVFLCITLHVHSSLHAVGLTAAISTALAQDHISANVIAGYFHDHIFVPKEQAHESLRILKRMSAQTGLL